MACSKKKSIGLFFAVALISWTGPQAHAAFLADSPKHGPFERPALALNGDTLDAPDAAPKPYVPGTDSALRQAAREARITRKTLGGVFVGGGSLLIVGAVAQASAGFMVNIFMSALGSEEQAQTSGVPLAVGGAMAGLGAYWLMIPWKAETIPIQNVGLTLYPSGRGAGIAFRF
jgi:hypothetical protein